MSVEKNFRWFRGDTWTLVVDCTDSLGSPVDVASARFRIANSSAALLTVTDLPSVAIDEETVTVTIPPENQEGIEGLVSYELQVTDTAGSISTQVHGVIHVHEGLFTRFA